MAIIDRSQLTDYEAEEVFVVDTPERLRALAHELRGRIVVLLRERAASTSELAEALGVPKGTVGHHVKVLERAGLIRVVATRRVRAVTERFYGRVGRLFLISSHDATAEWKDATFAAMMLRHGAEEIPRTAPDPDLMTAGLAHARLRPADARRLIKRLDKLFVDFRAAENPAGVPFGFAAAMYPVRPALPEPSDDA